MQRILWKDRYGGALVKWKGETYFRPGRGFSVVKVKRMRLSKSHKTVRIYGEQLPNVRRYQFDVAIGIACKEG